LLCCSNRVLSLRIWLTFGSRSTMLLYALHIHPHPHKHRHKHRHKHTHKHKHKQK